MEERFGTLTYAEKPSLWSNIYHPPHRLVSRITIASAFSRLNRMIRDDEIAAEEGFSELVYEPSFICHPDDLEMWKQTLDRLDCWPEPNVRLVIDLWGYEAYRMAGNGD